MDQIQQSLCDMKTRNLACLTDRNILRSALADYLPGNKLKQNLLLNAFDNDVVNNLRKGSDFTLNALNCISQLENDYGITKDAAFWAIQTWCYLLGLDAVGKNPNRINTSQNFMDKMYVRVEDGNYLKLESFETGVAHQFVVKSLE